MRRDGIPQVAEALGFTMAVDLYIWFLRTRFHWTLFVLAALVVASFIRHSETLGSLGLAGRAFVAAMAAWWRWLAPGISALAILAWMQAIPAHSIYRWFVYLSWCVLQQLLFQNMVHRRLRAALGLSWRASLCAGALFAAVHMPNPVLVPATFLWGTVSVRMFDSHPSVPALALWQSLLSTLLYWLTPVALSHQFRVGPGYWTW